MNGAGEAVGAVLKRVEDTTGKPVIVESDPSLKVIATSKTAGASSPAHVMHKPHEPR